MWPPSGGWGEGVNNTSISGSFSLVLRPQADQTSMSSTFLWGQDWYQAREAESSRQAGGAGEGGAEQGLVRQGLASRGKEFGFISIAKESH